MKTRFWIYPIVLLMLFVALGCGDEGDILTPIAVEIPASPPIERPGHGHLVYNIVCSCDRVDILPDGDGNFDIRAGDTQIWGMLDVPSTESGFLTCIVVGVGTGAVTECTRDVTGEIKVRKGNGPWSDPFPVTGTLVETTSPPTQELNPKPSQVTGLLTLAANSGSGFTVSLHGAVWSPDNARDIPVLFIDNGIDVGGATVLQGTAGLNCGTVCQ